jgi:RNA polymerase sigma-70 factor (ECF subfamily)
VGEKVLRRVAWQTSRVAGSADESLIRLEAVESVREALEELPPEQRQVVRMRIYEDKTFATIARELKIPLGTALGRMRAAMIKLKARLSGEPTENGERGA